MSVGLALLLSLALIGINGFFVAVELAYVASRRTKLEALADSGAFGARAAFVATENVTKQLFAAQLGITVASLMLGFIAEKAVAALIESAVDSILQLPSGLVHTLASAVALLFVVFVHTVFGEMVPKNLAIAAPEMTARLLSPAHTAVVAAARPVIWFLMLLAWPLLRIAGVSPDGGLSRAHTPSELARMLDESAAEGLVEVQEHTLLTGALDFADTQVSSVMIPLRHIVSITRSSTVREVEAILVEYGHSRLPIVGHDGSIKGFVHAKDLVRLPASAQNEALPLEVVRRAVQVTIDRTLEDVLILMRRFRVHLAVVHEPGGGPIGMLTLEDVLEQLVGEIVDESDR